MEYNIIYHPYKENNRILKVEAPSKKKAIEFFKGKYPPYYYINEVWRA